MNIKRMFLTTIGLLGGLILILLQGPQVAVAITLPGYTMENGVIYYGEDMHSQAESTKQAYASLTEWQREVVEMVVQQEAGHDYESALWVMTTILNRVDNPAFPDDIWSVVTQPSQFEAYGAEHYLRHQGNITEATQQAIQDAVSQDYRVHAYTGFFTDFYAQEKGQVGVSVGGNTYFNWE